MPVRIKSKRPNFRRCGIAHHLKAVEYPDDRFSKEEMAILKAEPMLIVEVVKRDVSAAEELEAMTVEQLKDEISKFQPDTQLKGVKKADLIEMLMASRGVAAQK